jgi:acyl-CoA synthetase (AMP-forming)/AMP-acid ligase II
VRVPLTVNDFLRRAETVYPDRIAVVDEPDQPAAPFGNLTYRELAAAARSQAAGLDDLGVPVGGRVAIVSHNAARLLTSFYGVSGSGRVLVPVNFRLAAAEVAYIVEHSGAEVLLVDPELEDSLRMVSARHRFVLGASDDAVFPVGREGRLWEGDEDATATINYTSGTTARPKGVQLTHRNLWVNAVTFAMHTTVSDRDVLLHTLPMFHANGWGMPYSLTGVGGRHIVLRKVDGAEILRRIEAHGVTLMCGAPAVLAAVLDAAATWHGPVPGRDSVRVVVAGAPPPTRTIERIETELGWEFIQIYGLTETAPLLTVNRRRAEWDVLDSRERAQRLGKAGAPALGIDLRVDEHGEILARGNVILESYWDDPDQSAVALDGGWFHTGDGGTFEDGYLTISDRKKDVIITGGENVSSIEVEDAVAGHPHVREVAVVGTPDAKWGEAVTALVVTDGTPLTAEDVIAHCRLTLAGYKCPKRVEFRDALPRTATGKLQKFLLRKEFWSGEERSIKG